MSNELKPCEDCGSKNIDMNRMECRDCGEWYGFKRPEEKPKIKLTKTLPSAVGRYYWAESAGAEMEILDVEECLISGELCVNISASIGVPPVDELGGYWAKVEQDHFEFEGE